MYSHYQYRNPVKYQVILLDSITILIANRNISRYFFIVRSTYKKRYAGEIRYYSPKHKKAVCVTCAVIFTKYTEGLVESNSTPDYSCSAGPQQNPCYSLFIFTFLKIIIFVFYFRCFLLAE